MKMLDRLKKAKKLYGEDKLIVLRMGDFYELFNEDAKVAAKVLKLTLQTRGKGKDELPMCGFPYHQIERHMDELRRSHPAVMIEPEDMLETKPADSHLEALEKAGFTVTKWLRKSVNTINTDGSTRSEWLPRGAINWDERQTISLSSEATNEKPVWECEFRNSTGGGFTTIQSALSWFSQLQDKKK